MFSFWQTYSIVITCKSTVPVPVADKEYVIADKINNLINKINSYNNTKVELGTVCKASCSQNGHLMLSMISYLNLSSGVYIPLY